MVAYWKNCINFNAETFLYSYSNTIFDDFIKLQCSIKEQQSKKNKKTSLIYIQIVWMSFSFQQNENYRKIGSQIYPKQNDLLK